VGWGGDGGWQDCKLVKRSNTGRKVGGNELPKKKSAQLEGLKSLSM
jgi:hypothetical protein